MDDRGNKKIWSWLFWKIRIPYSFYFLLIFFYHYFSVVVSINFANNIIIGKNSPGYGKIDWIFWKQDLNNLQNPQWHKNLLLILFLCFVLGGFLLNVFLFFLKRYCGELAKIWLRKLIIYRCQQSSQELVNQHKEEITSAAFGYVPHLATNLVNIPVDLFGNFLEIIFISYSLYFYGKTAPDQVQRIAINFSLIVLLIFFIYIYLTGLNQGKRNIARTEWSQKENKQIRTNLDILSFGREDAELITNRTFALFDSNLQKNRRFFIQQTISSLASLFIPGLNITFCFFYYHFDPKISFADVWWIYSISRDIQKIFWKLKFVLEKIPNCYETYGNYQNLKKILGKLKLRKNRLVWL